MGYFDKDKYDYVLYTHFCRLSQHTNTKFQEHSIIGKIMGLIYLSC